MMSGIRQRTFEQWVYRSRIDVGQWLKNNNIASKQEWDEWCDNNKLKRPMTATIQTHFTKPNQSLVKELVSEDSAKKIVATKKASRKRKTSSQEATEPWHTPAAQRPRRKTQKRKKKTNDS